MPQELNIDLQEYLRCCPLGDPDMLEAQEAFAPTQPIPFFIIIDENTNRRLKIQE